MAPGDRLIVNDGRRRVPQDAVAFDLDDLDDVDLDRVGLTRAGVLAAAAHPAPEAAVEVA